MNKMKRVTQIGRVKSGHRVEMAFPELMEGQLVEVSVTYDEIRSPETPDIMCFLSALPVGPRAYPNWDTYEQQLEQDKNSWDR